MAENVWNIFLLVFVIELFIFWLKAVGDSDGECHYEDCDGCLFYDRCPQRGAKING